MPRRSLAAALFVLAVVTLLAVVPSATQARAFRGAGPHEEHTHAEAVPRIEKLQHRPQAGLSLAVTPSVLSGASEVVTISWSGNVNASEFDWIAAYSPVPADEAGYLTQLPVKYMNLTSLPGESGSVTMWLLHMRAPWVFAYMRGGFDEPTVVALSNVVTYDAWEGQSNMPMQMHLLRTIKLTEMLLVWVTTDEPTPLVMWASSMDELQLQPFIANATTTTYTREQMCGGLAATIGWREPGSIHTAKMTDLVPGQQYFYNVASWTSPASSPVYSFVAPPALGSDVDFVIFGDLGQAEFDGTIEWEEWTTKTPQAPDGGDIDQPAAINTTRSVKLDLLEGRVSNETGIVLIIGDVSYARGREAMHDQFHYLLQPVATSVPVMTLLGNHDIDWTFSSPFPGTDSGGECGVAHQARFPMPSPPSRLADAARARGQGFSATPWYSFSHGAVHFVMMSSEHDFTKGTEQWSWLQSDLASVVRTDTPWVVMASHRPMYVSSTDARSNDSDVKVAELMREHLEPLLQAYEVDAFFAGHAHNYQRSCPVFNESCIKQEHGRRMHHTIDYGMDVPASPVAAPTFGTVHTLTGAAGQWCNVFLDPSPPDWLEFANVDIHGYTRAKVRGNELTLEFVASADRQVWDSVTIVKGSTKEGRAPVVRRNKSMTYLGDEERREAPIQEE